MSRLTGRRARSHAAHLFAFCVSAFILIVSRAAAHDGDFVISRDNASPPKLFLNGQSNLLDGSACVPPLRGDGALEGYFFNDAPGFATVLRAGLIRDRFPPLVGHQIVLRRVHFDDGLVLVEPSTFRPVLVRDGEEYLFVSHSPGDFNINMISRAPGLGPYRATLQLVDLAGLHQPSAPFTICFGLPAFEPVAGSVYSRLAEIPTTATQLAAVMIRLGGNPTGHAVSCGGGPGHVHGAHWGWTTARDFAEAVRELRVRLHTMDGWIVSKKYASTAEDAQQVRNMAALIARFAGEKGAGIPADEVEGVRRASVNAVSLCDAMTLSGNLSDAIAVREQYAALFAWLERCERFVAPMFVCPMRCDGGRLYAKMGKCPTCGMRLVDTRAHMDHQPKHGGIFFMAPDQRHHLEGTVVRGNEFRVYFYDEFTKAISAKPFLVVAEASNGEGEPFHPLPMTAASEFEFIRGAVSGSGSWSVRIRVDFRDGKSPQRFDFDFPRAGS